MRGLRSGLVAILVGLVGLVSACAVSPAPPRSPSSRCGACHPRPEAGEVAPAEWETVREGHAERLHLTVPEVEALEEELLRR